MSEGHGSGTCVSEHVTGRRYRAGVSTYLGQVFNRSLGAATVVALTLHDNGETCFISRRVFRYVIDCLIREGLYLLIYFLIPSLTLLKQAVSSFR